MFESLDAAIRRDDDPPGPQSTPIAEGGVSEGRGRDVRRALWVALVVGSVLNFINQGEAIFSLRQIDWIRAALTYAVPFFVSLHGAAQARRP